MVLFWMSIDRRIDSSFCGIEMALRDAGGNKGRAADQLALTYKMFVSKMREYGVPDEPGA